ncbi:MAG: hypothetical protein IT292_00275 [Deltaproteobacteria bacterium]|nr:hypothetical protein [Deltaproteobacteria bacterium]
MDIFSSSRLEIENRKSEQARRRAAEARKRDREAFYKQVEREERNLSRFSEADEGNLFRKKLKSNPQQLSKQFGKYDNYNINTKPNHKGGSKVGTINNVYSSRNGSSLGAGGGSNLTPSNFSNNSGSLMQSMLKK